MNPDLRLLAAIARHVKSRRLQASELPHTYGQGLE